MEKNIPVIHRARGYRLYTKNGKRLLDLWLAGGSAIMGHKPSTVTRVLKNTAEQGLFAPYPSTKTCAFEKALSKLFPECRFQIFSDHTRLRLALDKYGLLKQASALPDPGISEGNHIISLWRPFCPVPVAPFLVPVLPCALAPAVLVIKNDSQNLTLGPSDTIAPVFLAASTRALWDLLRNTTRAQSFPKVFKALETSSWKRRGLYLHSETKNETYDDLWQKFLYTGFLLPPSPNIPAILPGELSPGEEAALAALVK